MNKLWEAMDILSEILHLRCTFLFFWGFFLFSCLFLRAEQRRMAICNAYIMFTSTERLPDGTQASL